MLPCATPLSGSNPHSDVDQDLDSDLDLYPDKLRLHCTDPDYIWILIQISGVV